MSGTYKRFLASPSASLLADNAGLHYLTTLASFSGPDAILKHLETLRKQVTKKKEQPLTIIEGDNAIFLELETSLEFQTSGGTYVPGIDDNFLSDRVVHLPITHIVSFDAEGKIAQIRLQWDQGALLKQLEIIGKTGRNWPIKDSREQISHIQATARSNGAAATSGEVPIRNRGNSTNAMRDPYATLHMQGSREEIEAEAAARMVSPYAGTRPAQRSFTDILGDVPPEQQSPSASRVRGMSPAKAGQGRNHHPMRLFEGQEDAAEEDTPKGKPSSQQGIRPHPNKYNHFDFADGSDPADFETANAHTERPQKASRGKHDSQWSFDDFVTPAKAKATRAIRGEATRHWDTEGEIAGDTPVQPAGKARRDAETHFELQDDGERVEQPGRAGAKPRGSMHNENLGLYKNKLFDEDAKDATPTNTLGNITNLKDRGKDFAPHFAMTDDSPAPNKISRPLAEGQRKTLKMMDSNWTNYDEVPPMTTVHRDTKAPEDTRINIAGDGMGGRKGSNRDWLYGESEPELAPKPKAGAPPAAKKDFWDF